MTTVEWASPNGTILDTATAGPVTSRSVSHSTQSWERAIVARIAAGDDSALTTVFDQYGSLVYGIAVHLVGREEAPDVSQEVFTNLWASPDRFDPDRGTLRTYLAVMTRHRCIDTLRRTGRRQAREKRIGGDAFSNPPPNVEEAATALLFGEKVRRALDRLPNEQATAIRLAYLDGLTFQAVARAMSTPEGTAKSRLRLGLARLARELSDLGPETGEPSWT